MIAFMLQAGRAVLRPHLFAMLPGERAHAAADAMLTLLQLQWSKLDGIFPTDDIASSRCLTRPFHRLFPSRCASRG